MTDNHTEESEKAQPYKVALQFKSGSAVINMMLRPSSVQNFLNAMLPPFLSPKPDLGYLRLADMVINMREVQYIRILPIPIEEQAKL